MQLDKLEEVVGLIFTLYKKGGVYLRYGIEIYNSQNEIIFSSNNKTLQILDFGKFTLEQGVGAITINFPATNQSPTIWIEEIGLIGFVGNPDINKTYVIKPTVGNLSKNSNDEYFSFEAHADVVDVVEGTFDGGTLLPWTINYMVFV